jgi:adenine-specific DNA methylase
MTDFCSFLKKDRDKREITSLISSIPSNYVGSKRRMLLHIWNMIEDNDVKFDTAFDAFSGSAMVSLLFKMMGKRVISNDLLTSSAITAVCLMENQVIPITEEDLSFLCSNIPSEYGSFVKDNYEGKFFTAKECEFLDRYKANVAQLFGDKFYCGLDLLSKATLASIPNSNFSVYGKDLKALRSTHKVGKSFWEEKWRDTTRKRRDENNEIKFPESLDEMYHKYKGAFSLFAVENHPKNNGKEITDIPVSVEKMQKILQDGEATVFNSDIIELLESRMINSDLIYLDPPYGGSSSDYAVLYRFLEEYLYEDKLENLEHIQKGAKRFAKAKGYQEQFEYLLSLCDGFETWMISYNESSFANLETIKETIRKAGRKNIVVKSIPITYQYRKNKNVVDIEHFKENYYEEGYKFTERGTEFLILARK